MGRQFGIKLNYTISARHGLAFFCDTGKISCIDVLRALHFPYPDYYEYTFLLSYRYI